MDMETLERASILKSVIDKANQRIEKLETIKASDEIIVAINSPELKEALKHVYWGSKNLAPSYYSNQLKEKIIDVLIEDKVKFRDGRLEEFKKL